MDRQVDNHSHLGELPLRAGSCSSLLLVDDDRQLAEELKCGLAAEGFLVDVAHDGSEALQKITMRPFDAVICDVMMPRLRGDELYRLAIENRPSVRNRFIFITGFPANTYFNAFLSRTRCLFLFKPFPIQYLIDGVRQLTGHA